MTTSRQQLLDAIDVLFTDASGSPQSEKSADFVNAIDAYIIDVLQNVSGISDVATTTIGQATAVQPGLGVAPTTGTGTGAGTITKSLSAEQVP